MNALGTTIGDIATLVAQMMVELFQTLVSIFVEINQSTGDFQLTVFGYLLLFTAVCALVVFLIRWIASLIRFKAGN